MVLMLSIVSFAGSTIFGMARTFSEVSSSTSQMSPDSQEQSQASYSQRRQAELEAQLRGYELVLKREPDNATALEGLANTRIQMNDYKGAIGPLEKLVKLNPGRSDYAALLNESKQKAGDRS